MSDFKIVKLLEPISLNLKPNFTGEYSAVVTYQIGDSVSYGDSSYVAKAITTGNEPTNSTYWQILASGISDEDVIVASLIFG